jgi:hypothetical protein
LGYVKVRNVNCSFLISLTYLIPDSAKAETKFAFELAGKSQTIGSWQLFENKDAFDDKTHFIALLGGETSYLQYPSSVELKGQQAAIQLSCHNGQIEFLINLTYDNAMKFSTGDKVGFMLGKTVMSQLPRSLS